MEKEEEALETEQAPVEKPEEIPAQDAQQESVQQESVQAESVQPENVQLKEEKAESREAQNKAETSRPGPVRVKTEGRTFRGEGRGRDRERSREREPLEKEFIEKLVKLNRTAKVVKGGRRFSFSALTVIGDRKGNVGYGFGKANDVSEAIRKSIEKAKRNMIPMPVKNGTIPHEIIGAFKASRVLLKPACSGTGIIAGGPVRAIM
jgi:small subunit ribosomal protein S5